MANDAHDFITVKNRRWCVGCGLFQNKRKAGASFPEAPTPCPRDTPRARQEDAKRREAQQKEERV